MSKAAVLLKAWELSAVDLILGVKLGEGGQATVFRGKWQGFDVAIKQARMRYQDKGGAKAEQELSSITQMIRREVRALARVRHPNVVRLHGACFEPTPMVVMAYAPLGTLQDAFDENKFTGIAEVARLLAGIARGMEAVHAHKIIHLDLKPENVSYTRPWELKLPPPLLGTESFVPCAVCVQVLIGPANTPWITDFGLSTSANDTSMSKSSAGGRGTLPFKAPELLSYPPHVSQAADVYAFGILAWCVISGEKPFASMESAASLPSAIDQGERPALADGRDWRELTTGNVAKLVEACWVGRYQDRPEFGRPETGVVATLEKLETALAKSTDEEAQIDLINRLIAVESEEHNSVKYVKEIDEALSEAKAEQPDGGDGELLMATQVPIATLVTASEKKELEEEKKGAVVNVEVVRQNARRARDQIRKRDARRCDGDDDRDEGQHAQALPGGRFTRPLALVACQRRARVPAPPCDTATRGAVVQGQADASPHKELRLKSLPPRLP